MSASSRTVVSTDLLLEGVHFPAGRLHPAAVGRKAFLVNLSDIAAMGARPKACLLGLALPPDSAADRFDQLLDGFLDEALRYQTPLIGGDLCASDRLFLAVTIFGETRSGEPLTRDGAQPGDDLFLLGTVGLSVLGLRTVLEDDSVPWEQITSPSDLESLLGEDPRATWIRAHLFPTVQVEPAVWLQERNLAGAMIDVSDGLVSDVAHLCEESRLRAIIHKRKLPLPQAGDQRSSEDFLKGVLHGGEDYALAFSATPAQSVQIESKFPGKWPRPRKIGTFEKGLPGVFLLDGAERVECPPLGFDHFREPGR